MVDDARVTIRLSAGDLQLIDTFVEAGEFRDRSEAIRRAIKDFLNSRAKEVIESIKNRQALVAEVQALQSMQAAAESQKDAIERLNRT